MMKISIFILSILMTINLCSQEANLVRLAFEEKSNFDITTVFGNARPSKFYVLPVTDKWGGSRFKLKENLNSPGVRKALERDEHHPYNHSYIFKDSAIDKLFTDKEKGYLFEKSQAISPGTLVKGAKPFVLIESFKAARSGFFFSVTDPLLSSDSLYAFLDISVYRKDEESRELNDTYYGSIFLIFHRTGGKEWTQLKRMTHLIL